MAVIKSGASTDQLTVDPVSKAARVTQYDSAGNEITINDPTPVVIVVNPVTVINNDIVASFDVSTYKFLSLQLTGTWVGTVSFQGSNDNGTFEDVVSQDMGEQTSPYSESTTTTGIYKIPTAFNFLRVRVTAYTSGTVDGIALAYAEDSNTGQISATGAVSLNAGVNQIGSVLIDPSPTAMSTDLYVGLAGDALLNARNIKNAPTTLRSLTFTNLAATPRYLKIYDTAGVPTAGAGSPVLLVSLASPGTLAFPLPSEGFVFANGIGMTMTLKPPNADTTNTATVDFSMVSVFTT
jgi:hypothetical protein